MTRVLNAAIALMVAALFSWPAGPVVPRHWILAVVSGAGQTVRAVLGPDPNPAAQSIPQKPRTNTH